MKESFKNFKIGSRIILPIKQYSRKQNKSLQNNSGESLKVKKKQGEDSYSSLQTYRPKMHQNIMIITNTREDETPSILQARILTSSMKKGTSKRLTHLVIQHINNLQTVKFNYKNRRNTLYVNVYSCWLKENLHLHMIKR